jgi:IS1 family transposase
MNVLPIEKQTQIANCLVEGTSLRATARMCGVERNTVGRVLLRIGDRCAWLLNDKLRRIRSRRVEVDEIWTFVFKKQARLSQDDDESQMGDQYVFTAMDSETKLMISHRVGKRDATTAYYLMQDLESRLANRVQLTTDGFRPYLMAVEDSFGADIDYAVLVKVYGAGEHKQGAPEWYGPPRVISALPMPVMGKPQPRYISTSYVERQNLTIRMQVRRFTRLTNAFSKKLANLKAQVALHFAHYNFVRIHQTLRVTPAMAAGITDQLWSLEDLVGAQSLAATYLR